MQQPISLLHTITHSLCDEHNAHIFQEKVTDYSLPLSKPITPEIGGQVGNAHATIYRWRDTGLPRLFLVALWPLIRASPIARSRLVRMRARTYQVFSDAKGEFPAVGFDEPILRASSRIRRFIRDAAVSSAVGSLSVGWCSVRA